MRDLTKHAFALAAALVVPTALPGCGDDGPTAVSEPVGITLKVKSSDVDPGGAAVELAKAVTTESGNPYGAFVADATAKLGHAPSRIPVTAADLQVLLTSKDVTRLDEVFAAPIALAFSLDVTNTRYDVATIATPGGIDEDFVVAFDGTEIADADTAKYLDGSFKVTLASTAATTFASDGSAEADLQATLTFAGYP